MDFKFGELTFISDFDSSNIARVELVHTQNNDCNDTDNVLPGYEFNIWTRPDCAGTEFENNNRTWFYFGIKGTLPTTVIKLNICNLNRQTKLYEQGMAPVYKVSPGSNQWERVRGNISYIFEDNKLTFTFDYHPLENLCSTTYFAFTYPFSFTELQNIYKNFESRLKKYKINSNPLEASLDDIYYHRECLIKSLEGRPIDLITISSHHGITNTRELRLRGLFPEVDVMRPFQFKDKKVIFFSARVHPGETPSSFVMNGVLKLLLSRTDPIALALRKLYVFKLIPILNPDGVSRGFYRTDTRGVNLNRYYLNPSRKLHPSVFAARSLIIYYHCGCDVSENADELSKDTENIVDSNKVEYIRKFDDKKSNESIAEMVDLAGSLSEKAKQAENIYANIGRSYVSYRISEEELNVEISKLHTSGSNRDSSKKLLSHDCSNNKSISRRPLAPFCNDTIMLPSNSNNNNSYNGGVMQTIKSSSGSNNSESGLFLYIDFHAHASKKGIFMYGNYFDNVADKVECMLLPKLMSINNQHFHYNSCNFSKHNMHTRGRDGLSKEGCGRVAIWKITGLVRSYTLECNYNTGCMVNIIPPTPKPLGRQVLQPLLVPPKYAPQIYEEVGHALCVSVLDMTGGNLNSRLETSQFRNLNGLKEAIRLEIVSSKISSNDSCASAATFSNSTMSLTTRKPKKCPKQITNFEKKTDSSKSGKCSLRRKNFKKKFITTAAEVDPSSYSLTDIVSSADAAAVFTGSTAILTAKIKKGKRKKLLPRKPLKCLKISDVPEPTTSASALASTAFRL